MVRCKICGKDLKTVSGWRKHTDNCEFEQKMKRSSDILNRIKRNMKKK